MSRLTNCCACEPCASRAFVGPYYEFATGEEYVSFLLDLPPIEQVITEAKQINVDRIDRNAGTYLGEFQASVLGINTTQCMWHCGLIPEPEIQLAGSFTASVYGLAHVAAYELLEQTAYGNNFPNMNYPMQANLNDVPETQTEDTAGTISFSESGHGLVDFTRDNGTFAYELRLTLNGQTRRVNDNGWIFLQVYWNFYNIFAVNSNVSQCSLDDGTVAVTSWSGRGGWLGLGATHAGFTYGQGRESAVEGYSSVPYATLSGRKCSLYRNGEPVFEDMTFPESGLDGQPFTIDATEYTSENGSYFLVSVKDEDTRPAADATINPVFYLQATYTGPIGVEPLPWSGPYNRHLTPELLKDFASFVKDDVPPIVWVTPINDVFEGESGTQLRPPMRVLATEPLQRAATFLYGEIIDRAGFSSDVGLPAFVYRYALYDVQTGEQTPEQVGNYVLRFMTPSSLRDLSGNMPAANATTRFSVRPRNQYDKGNAPRRGAVAGISVSGAPTNHPTPMKAFSARVTFDRKVDPAGITPSMFRLLVNGQFHSLLQAQPVGDGSRAYTLLIPQDVQTPGTFLTIEFDPNQGNLFTDDLTIANYSSVQEFPQFGTPKTIYVVNGVRYDWRPFLSYQPIDGEYPRDFLGDPYEPEKCVLASRAGWLMSSATQAPTLIDTQRTPLALDAGYMPTERADDTVGIGRAASVYAEIPAGAEIPSGIELETQGDVFIQATFGGYRKKPAKAFWPGVPRLQDSEPDCSYFRLPTTIDPCPPGRFDDCAAPRGPQRHASAIRIVSNDITGIRVRPIAYTTTGAEMSFEGTKHYNGTTMFGPALMFTLEDLFSGGSWSALPFQLLLKHNQSIECTDTLDGCLQSQNVWSAIGNLDTQLPLNLLASYGTRSSTGGYVIGGNFQMNVAAARNAAIFDGLATTTLSELVLEIYFRIAIEGKLSMADSSNDSSADIYSRVERRLFSTVTVSREDEESFASGETIVVPGSTIFGWRNLFWELEPILD